MLHTLGCDVCAHTRLEVVSNITAANGRYLFIFRKMVFRTVSRHIDHFGMWASGLEGPSCGVHFRSDAAPVSDFSLRDSCLKLVSTARWIRSPPHSSGAGCKLRLSPEFASSLALVIRSWSSLS